jgi:hypothetical protein
VGIAFSAKVTVNGDVDAVSVSALPPGLSFNQSTNTISGTPTATGSFNVQVSATNQCGGDNKTVVISISNICPVNPPVISSQLGASGTIGSSFAYTITGSNNPTTFTLTGTLPTGLTFNQSTGVISGTPTQTGTFVVTIGVTNQCGNDTKQLTVVIPIGGSAMGTAIQVSVVIAAIVCAVCAIYFSVRDENPRNKLALCFFGLMALFVSSSLYFEFCGFGVLGEGAGASVVTVYRNGEWTSSRWGAFELGEGQTFNVPDEFAATRSVTPITENPKARRVTYTVLLEITNPGTFFRHEGRWEKRDKYDIAREVRDTTEFWLYEFNDKHSKELAKFYNPLDRAQVMEFEELLLPWLNDKINREGLRAKSLSFTVD